MCEGKKCERPIARIQCDTPFLFVRPNPETLVTSERSHYSVINNLQ